MEGTPVKLSFQPWRMSTRETQKIPFKSDRGRQQATAVPSSKLKESYTDSNGKQAAHQRPNSLQG